MDDDQFDEYGGGDDYGGGDYGDEYGGGDDYGDDYYNGDDNELQDFGSDNELVDPDSNDMNDEADMEPEDILENAWLTAKEEEGTEQASQLKKLLEKEKELMGDDKTKFGLKALKRLMLNSHNAGNHAEVLSYAQQMAKSYKQQMREHMQSITALLEKLADSKEILQIVDLVLDVVNPKDNKTRVKLSLVKAKCLQSNGRSEREIEKVLDEAHDLCRQPNGSDNVSQSSLLLDIYGLKITRADEQENNKLLKSYFEKAIPLTTAGLASNAVLGVIFRCGGRARMRDHKYADASQHFFDAFKNYDECRNVDMSVECLKLLVFSSLLGGSKVNPFDDKRASSHTSKQEIKNFEKLVKDVLSKNIESFERSIKPMTRDPLVQEYVPELTKLIQKDVFLDLARPYSNLSLKFITEKIHASDVDQTEELLVELILDKKVFGTINQRAGILSLIPPKTVAENYYNNLYNVSTSVANLTRNVMLSVH